MRALTAQKPATAMISRRHVSDGLDAMRSRLLRLVFLAGLIGPAQAQTYVSVGYGGVACTSWTTKKPIEGRAYEAWIFGFISSYNAYVYKGPNVIEGVTIEELRAWFDTYCKKSPDSKLDSAVRALIDEQVQKGPG
jgi:hypothetical protein